jgi:hypothetical protein
MWCYRSVLIHPKMSDIREVGVSKGSPPISWLAPPSAVTNFSYNKHIHILSLFRLFPLSSTACWACLSMAVMTSRYTGFDCDTCDHQVVARSSLSSAATIVLKLPRYTKRTNIQRRVATSDSVPMTTNTSQCLDEI